MIGNKLEQKIIALYDRNIADVFSINQISKKLGKKYPYINKKVKELIKRGIILKRVVGKSHLCSLNMDNEETILLLITNEMNKKILFLEKIKKLQPLITALNQIKNETTIHSAIINNKNLILVLENFENEKLIRSKLDFSDFGIIILTKRQFKKALLDLDILENHILLYGYERYFEFAQDIQDKIKLRFSPLI